MPVDESIPRQWHPPKLIIWRFLKDNSVVTLHEPFCRINALGPMVCENERCTGFHEKTPFQLARSLKLQLNTYAVRSVGFMRLVGLGA
jgi:hypothetical protein